MIQVNYLYAEFFNDLAKLYGNNAQALYSADSWVNEYQINGVIANSYIDLRQAGTIGITAPTAPACFYVGNWSIYMTASTFTLAGGCVLTNAFAPTPGGTPPATQQDYQMGARFFAAADSNVGSKFIVPFANIFQYSDTIFSNYARLDTSGVGNSYTLRVKFDGARVSF